MEIDELKAIIQGAGGGTCALEYADSLKKKIDRVEAVEEYKQLINQLRSAKEEGDFRGRVLEINFANLFLEKGVVLQYGAKQGTTGDVDFCWALEGSKAFIEMKLLGQDREARAAINSELEAKGFSSTVITEDTWDVARLQRDIFQKSSTKKFNPTLQPNSINMVAVDVSELQIGTVDFCDCIVAAAGNGVASQHCHEACLRPRVVGVFERADVGSLSADQVEWVKGYHSILGTAPHPRDYIHGVVCLFREPKQRAALSYALGASIVWNLDLVDGSVAKAFSGAFHRIVPFATS